MTQTSPPPGTTTGSAATLPQQQAGPTRAAGPREDERRQLERVRAELVREFAGRLGQDAVERRFAATVAAFEGAPIRSFVPVLAQRRVRLELRGAGAHPLPARAVAPA